MKRHKHKWRRVPLDKRRLWVCSWDWDRGGCCEPATHYCAVDGCEDGRCAKCMRRQRAIEKPRAQKGKL